MTDGKVLAGKVAVVTGAGRGIGAAIALALAEQGATVCCTARTATEIEATAAAIAAAGGSAFARVCDVTDTAAIEALYAETARRAGGIDLLVLNAGAVFDTNPIETADPTSFEAMLRVNLVGPYQGARLAIPYLRARGGGRMIMVGSGQGHSRAGGTAGYACAKAGLWMLVRILADELRNDGISVNELVPGPVRTAMTAGNLRPNAAVNNPIEWVKEPEDVVPMAMFLATCPGMGPTGQSFSIMRRVY